MTQSKYYPNMDVMRYVLSVCIIVSHFSVLVNGYGFQYLSFYRVGGFFAMSGFLVYPAYKKIPQFRKYVTRRAFRILPPYLFIVLLCSFGLVLVSRMPALEYFSSYQWWKYLVCNLCFLNWLQPDLPGVFGGEEYLGSAVNGALWTMKVEWFLFLSVPLIFGVARRLRIGNVITCISVVLISIVYRVALIKMYEVTGIQVYEMLSRQFIGQMAYYYSGIAIYFLKEHFIRRIPVWLILSILLGFMVVVIPYGLYTIAPIVVSVTVLGISLAKFAPIVLNHRHNLSYGMYLFHFPIIQVLIGFGMRDWPAYMGIGVVMILTVGLAAFCHFCIELPIADRYIKKI